MSAHVFLTYIIVLISHNFVMGRYRIHDLGLSNWDQKPIDQVALTYYTTELGDDYLSGRSDGVCDCSA